MMRRQSPVRIFASAMLIAALGAGTAHAESCLDQVRQLADRQGVSTDPPTVAPDGGRRATPQELGRSGGVVEPPAIRDESVISPPRNQTPAMPTMPDVKRSNPSEQSERATLQALLVAARAQAERGNERGCQEQLEKAHQVVERGQQRG
jgi:hypothetical protein